jgi:Uma2 family endonuclease
MMNDMGAASQTVSLKEYLEVQSVDGTKDELIQGEVVISPSGSPNHALLMKRLVRLLDGLVDGNEFEVNSDLSIIVNPADPASMPRPDVFVMDRVRFLAAARQERFPEGAPELAIEIVSPSNTRKDLRIKVGLYLRHGSLAVWVVYPKRRSVMVWHPEDAGREYGERELIPLPESLSGHSLAVADIFSVLPK